MHTQCLVNIHVHTLTCLCNDCSCILQACLAIQTYMATLVVDIGKAPLHQDWEALFTCIFVPMENGHIEVYTIPRNGRDCLRDSNLEDRDSIPILGTKSISKSSRITCHNSQITSH